MMSAGTVVTITGGREPARHEPGEGAIRAQAREAAKLGFLRMLYAATPFLNGISRQVARAADRSTAKRLKSMMKAHALQAKRRGGDMTYALAA